MTVSIAAVPRRGANSAEGTSDLFALAAGTSLTRRLLAAKMGPPPNLRPQ